MGYLIQIKLEATKIKEEKIVDDFISNIKTDFCNLQKIHKKSGYGCLLTTKFATLDEINSSEEFRFVLQQMTSLGFKAHDAKNNYMHIVYKTDGNICNSYSKKVDLFILNNKELCKKIARKDKVFNFNFTEKYFAGLANNHDNLGKPPIIWSENDAKFVFFRSTLKFETIMASVEFVKTLFDFADNGFTFEMLFDNNDKANYKYIDYIKSNSMYFMDYYYERVLQNKI